MKYLFFIVLFVKATVSFSQDRLMDSIADAFSKCKVDTAKIDIILSEYAYLSDSKPIKAIEYGKAALKIAQAINDKKRECAVLDLIGQGYDQLGTLPMQWPITMKVPR